MNDKLLKIQSELKAPKGQENTFAKYKYRSCEDILEAVKPLLKENKLTLILTDEVVNIGNHNYVKSTAILSEKDNEATATTSAYAREAEVKKGMDDAQITGACSSYARKYALNGLFAIDDTKDADTQDNTHEPEIVAEMDKVVLTKPQKATTKQIEMLFNLAKQRGYTEKLDAHKWLSDEAGKDILLTSSAEASKLIGELMGE